MLCRKLSADEISALVAGGSTAASWDDVEVSDGFDPSRVRRCNFSGKVRIGALDGSFTLEGGMVQPCGLYDASFHDVNIGHGCLIRNVRRHIACYDIGDGTLIDGVGLIAMSGPGSFGNGVEVSVLDESGTCSVKICDAMSSHQAYIAVLYRHRPALRKKLDELACRHAAELRSGRGSIGRDCRITDCGDILDVRAGDGVRMDGASLLCNGTLAGKPESPVFIGRGVICRDFIISGGSEISDGATLTRCFVGQACRIGRGFSACDSLFFSNFHGEQGEACSVFAGPFTVTHHKSTLLIAGMFSFMNAGSGSNQSNHMYRLGPLHWGTMERGTKTCSDSYILWPARVGAFSIVSGRHYGHPDSSGLPFSYLIGEGGRSVLVPGVVLKNAGTRRDAIKWPARDARSGPVFLDHVNSAVLSPYTVGKILKGIKTLEALRDSGGESGVYSWNGMEIGRSSLEKGLDYYKMAVDRYFGDVIVSRLCDENGHPSFRDEAGMRALLHADTGTGRGEWLDLGGLIAPESEVEALMSGIESGKYDTLSCIAAGFRTMAENYRGYELNWVLQHAGPLDTFDDAARVIESWKHAVETLGTLIGADAGKDSELACSIAPAGGNESPGGEFMAALSAEVRSKSETADRVLRILRQTRP